MPSILNALLSLFNQDIVQLATNISRLAHSLLLIKKTPGVYEVLEYDARLELKDRQGKKAIYYKRQKVRFLQDNVIAYEDKAWGDGNIFADYKCTPGVPVDRYREGHRYRILISLREAKKLGDIEEFHIQRAIKDGFTKDSEDFQTEIDHKTHNLSLSVVFPRGRAPKQAEIIEQNLARTTQLDGNHIQLLPDGRYEVSWSKEHPRLFEAYIIRWKW